MPENTGTVRQPLVGATISNVDLQEDFGLLSFASTGPSGGTCSASLLRNNWAICAAHCVEVGGATGSTTPDPARPGQNILINPASVSLTATWGGGQTIQAVQIQTFRPYDIAIIRVATPFKVMGKTNNVSRLIFQDGQFPYFGTYPGTDILVFGRGISTFAQRTPQGDIPSVIDGLYRMGFARINKEENNRVWYPSEGGLMIAGGDSGGPSFAYVAGGWALVGVHSLAKTTILSGHPPNPAWAWVTSTPEAADAPIAPVIDDIITLMGAQPSSSIPDNAPPPQFIGKFPPPTPNKIPAFIYGETPAGQLLWYRHDGAQTGEGINVAGAWKGASTVGVGWNGFKNIFVGDGNIIYGISQDGSLRWYCHDGFNTGLGINNNGWSAKSGKVVGNGWGQFKSVFSGGKGIIYAITNDGILRWYNHVLSRTGEGTEVPGAWLAPKDIGTGWQNFKTVFSGGDGIIYAIENDGTLKWYKHIGFEDGSSHWEGPHNVGNGWADFTGVFSSGNAVDGVIIYAVTKVTSFVDAVGRQRQKGGELLWYKHKGFQKGTFDWEGSKTVGQGWGNLSHLFAFLPGRPEVIR